MDGAGGDPRKEFGRKGEELGVVWLKKEGWKIEARNWRCRLGEIDIVASRKGMVCLVEVKTRRSARFGGGGEAVSSSKQKRLARLAAAYLQSRKDSLLNIEFGVLSILWDSDVPKVEFIRNAFEARGLY